MPIVRVPTKEIEDRESFHDVFSRILGFPEFYGRNMDAWIDCLTSADDREAGMIASELVAVPGDVLTLDLEDAAEFAERCPAEYADVIECSAFVNRRRIDVGQRRSSRSPSTSRGVGAEHHSPKGWDAWLRPARTSVRQTASTPMSGSSRDPATVAALTDTIVFELRAQLVDAGLDLDQIEAIAAMVADQVLTEWDVSPRPGSRKVRPPR